jgi:hypothetical protein
VSRISGPELGEMIRTRHPEAGHYLHLILKGVAWMQDRSRPPPLCICCPYEFGYDELPEEFVVCRPFAANDGETAFASALCGACAQDPDILDRIMAAYRRDMFRDMAIVAYHDLDQRRQ